MTVEGGDSMGRKFKPYGIRQYSCAFASGNDFVECDTLREALQFMRTHKYQTLHIDFDSINMADFDNVLGSSDNTKE
jgi:hypothetical protein